MPLSLGKLHGSHGGLGSGRSNSSSRSHSNLLLPDDAPAASSYQPEPYGGMASVDYHHANYPEPRFPPRGSAYRPYSAFPAAYEHHIDEQAAAAAASAAEAAAHHYPEEDDALDADELLRSIPSAAFSAGGHHRRSQHPPHHTATVGYDRAAASAAAALRAQHFAEAAAVSDAFRAHSVDRATYSASAARGSRPLPASSASAARGSRPSPAASARGRRWAMEHNPALRTRMEEAFYEFINTPHSFGRRQWESSLNDPAMARAYFDRVVRLEALHEVLYNHASEELLPFFQLPDRNPLWGFFENSAQVYHLFAALLAAFVGEKCTIQRCGTVFCITHRRSVTGSLNRVLTHMYVSILKQPSGNVWSISRANQEEWESEQGSGLQVWTYEKGDV